MNWLKTDKNMGCNKVVLNAVTDLKRSKNGQYIWPISLQNGLFWGLWLGCPRSRQLRTDHRFDPGIGKSFVHWFRIGAWKFSVTPHYQIFNFKCRKFSWKREKCPNCGFIHSKIVATKGEISYMEWGWATNWDHVKVRDFKWPISKRKQWMDHFCVHYVNCFCFIFGHFSLIFFGYLHFIWNFDETLYFTVLFALIANLMYVYMWAC